MEKLELSSISDRNIKWCSHYIFLYIKQFLKRLHTELLYDPAAILGPQYRWIGSMCQHKNSHVNICSSITHSCQKDKKLERPSAEEMDDKNVVYPKITGVDINDIMQP